MKLLALAILGYISHAPAAEAVSWSGLKNAASLYAKNPSWENSKVLGDLLADVPKDVYTGITNYEPPPTATESSKYEIGKTYTYTGPPTGDVRTGDKVRIKTLPADEFDDYSAERIANDNDPTLKGIAYPLPGDAVFAGGRRMKTRKIVRRKK